MVAAPAPRGLVVALPTFFDADGRLDAGALSHVLRYVQSEAICGVVVGTEAGEGAFLRHEELLRLVEQTAAELDSKCALWVQANSVVPAELGALAGASASHPVGGLVMAPPRTPGLGYRGLYRCVELAARAGAARIALLVRADNELAYLTTEEADTLARHDAVHAAWIGHGRDWLSAWGDRMKALKKSVLWGAAFDCDAAWERGADGVFCGLSVLAIKQAVAHVGGAEPPDAARTGPFERRVRALSRMIGPPSPWDELSPWRKLGVRLAGRPESGGALRPLWRPAGIKFLLAEQGHPVSPKSRPPADGLSEQEADTLRSVAREAALLPDK